MAGQIRRKIRPSVAPNRLAPGEKDPAIDDCRAGDAIIPLLPIESGNMDKRTKKRSRNQMTMA